MAFQLRLVTSATVNGAAPLDNTNASATEWWRILHLSLTLIPTATAGARRPVMTFVDPPGVGAHIMRVLTWDTTLAANPKVGYFQTISTGAPDKVIVQGDATIAMAPFNPIWLPPGGLVHAIDLASIDAADNFEYTIAYEIWELLPDPQPGSVVVPQYIPVPTA